MLQIDPEALVLRFCHQLLQRIDHLSLSIGQSECYGMDDMFIGNCSTVYYGDIVVKYVLELANSNRLLSDFQLSYLLCHSTETALLKVTNDLLLCNG